MSGWIWGFLASFAGFCALLAWSMCRAAGNADQMAEEMELELLRRKRIDPDYNPEDRHG